MHIMRFDAIRNDIIRNIKRHMLIPFIGSGFTRNCPSQHGTVPSGDDYRKYMIKTIAAHPTMASEDTSVLFSESFSSISSLYHEIIPKENRLDYLRDNFTHVSIESYKKEFLSLDWPYVYTLNIDDGIERNSPFNTVIYSNRRVYNNIFDKNKCVIKLHGDVMEMLSYEDAKSEVFDQKQYVLSIKNNKSLLTRLAHDYSYQNIIYVGCSLDDEIDIISAANTATNGNARYFCTVKEPSYIERIRLKDYSITHCIIFNSYQEIYGLICDAAEEACQIETYEIDNYKSFAFKRLNADFETNKPYLFYGKSLINSDRTITIPYFFITRNVTEKILVNIDKYALQLVLGNSCSGKTYIAIDVALHIRDRDVFIFESKDSISDAAFNNLINRGSCLIIADNGSLNIQQIEWLIRNEGLINKNNIHIVIVSNKNNRDLIGLIRYLEINDKVKRNAIPQIFIENRFSSKEIKKLNNLLVETTLGVFTEHKTVADNIISTSQMLLAGNRFSNIIPSYSDKRMIACLIALTIEKKIYSYQMIEYDIEKEMCIQQKVTAPLIEEEITWDYEISPANNSGLKYIINAEYWLNYQLDIFSQAQKNHETIVSAFRHIISQIVMQYGKPDIMNSERNAKYKPYILFDNINRIFKTQGLTLARSIYDSLNDLLASDPNYMHQRAKCLIKFARLEKTTAEKNRILEKAYRYASIAYGAFNKRYEDSGNEKVLISMAHVKYTLALILCHSCKNIGYQNIEKNTIAVQLLCGALNSQYNSYEFMKADTFNYGNAISSLISATVSNKSLVKKEAHSLLEELYKKIITHPETV